MVIYFEWHRTAMDQRSSSGFPVTGEDTGLGALASPLAGYLGKVQDRCASLEYCPWCTSKGLTYALRSYRVNLQESITLCTNPQCLFPLVSRSLEDVLGSLEPVEPSVGNKRKNVSALEIEELIEPAHKRLRSSELDSHGPESITDALNSHAEHDAANVIGNGQHAAPETDDEKVNGYHGDSPVAETTEWEEPEDAACTDGFAPRSCAASGGLLQGSSDALSTADGDKPALSPHRGALGVSEVEVDIRRVKKSPPEVLTRPCSVNSNQSSFTNGDSHSAEITTPSPQHKEQSARTEQKSLAADVTTCTDTGNIKSETDLSSTTVAESEEFVPVPNQLFWRNSDNLCWLDSLLVALVNCKSLRKCKPKDEPRRSSVWRLLQGYEDVCAAVQVHQQIGKDGVVRVPNHVLQKADADLQSLRMSIFKQLQPKLHCKLGERETPVFAMPLLLTDSWVKPLFQSTFRWEFKCSECKAATKERVTKTLPTFTKILPEWHPLRAVHSAPCNVCGDKNQRRTLMLERVPPVLQLHFVEGLPDNDVGIYTFTFKGKRYSVTTVIQYNHQLKHFVTWVCKPDGSWLEYDDLKHPDCKTHPKLPVPAQEMHVVFWEVEEDKESRACSPSSTFAESPPAKNEMNSSLCDKDLIADELLSCTPDQSLLACHNDTDIVCALSVSEDGSNTMDTTITAGVDTSIGSTTLLDTFEGLTHSDIITLTLVELKTDLEAQPLNASQPAQGLSVPSSNEVLDSPPDSSCAVTGSEMPRGPDVEIPATSNSSESEGGLSSDPTFVPGAKRGQRSRRGMGRGTIVTRQASKKAVLSKAVPHISPPASSGPSKATHKKSVSSPAQDNPPLVETTQQASPVSSTDASPPSTIKKSPTMPQTLDQNARWSFLLSKQLLHQVHKSNATFPPTPVTQVKPTPPTHSTPNPVRRQAIPAGLFPKPQLKTEESDSLPLKAAEMYGAFGAKSSYAPSPLPSPALLNGNSKLFQPITSNHQKSLTNPTAVSGASLPMPVAKGLLDVSRKRSSRSSKVPPGLSDTEALRYKLLKKLKAKKKELAKLNKMLGHQVGAGLRPDSTDLGSPNTVTSSTYDGSICDDFLSDLLSPATTASNLSPDSTGFLEMLTNGQDRVDQLDCGVNAVGAVPQINACMNEPNTENFLEDFFSQAAAQRPTDMETEALSALEYFV